MDVIAESVEFVEFVYENRNNITGMKMIFEPEYLRFIKAIFEKI